MADQRADQYQEPAFNTLRLVFTLIGFIAAGLGYLGLARFLHGSTDYGDRPWDLAYYDLQMFVLGSDPLQQPGPYPISLEIARFAAPVVTVYALVEAFRVLWASERRRWRARRARGHVVVCGDDQLADALCRQLRAAGRETVQVRRGTLSPAAPFVGVSGPVQLVGDPRDPNMLRAAGVPRASALYAVDSDSAANIAIGLVAGQIRAQWVQPLRVYARIQDPDLCLTLQARYLGMPQPSGVQLDFFNVDDLAARKLFSEEPVSGPLLVIGATAFGRAVVVEAGRHWRLAASQEPRPPLPLTLVGEGATTALEQVTTRYPFLRTACKLTAHDSDLLPLLAAGELRDPPARAVICYDDEEYALKTAMTAERFWRGTPGSVVVRLDQLAASRAGMDSTRLFAEASGTLRVYGVSSAASDPDLISEDLVDRLARVIHERYRMARRLRGDSPERNRSMAPWNELPAALRQSNREQAEDIGRKLRAIGCVLVPRIDDAHLNGKGTDNGNGLLDPEVARLAVMEHERWCEKQVAAGWRHGAAHDETRKLHPGLLPWANLPDEMRQRNHDIVKEVPMILADAGFQIVRG